MLREGSVSTGSALKRSVLWIGVALIQMETCFREEQSSHSGPDHVASLGVEVKHSVSMRPLGITDMTISTSEWRSRSHHQSPQNSPGVELCALARRLRVVRTADPNRAHPSAAGPPDRRG